MLLENKLAKWLVRDKDGPDGAHVKLRPFSHVAAHPGEVERWVKVALDELGDVVVFDVRSCEAMHDKDVTFYVAKNRATAFLRAVRISAGPEMRRALAQKMVTRILSDAVAARVESSKKAKTV